MSRPAWHDWLLETGIEINPGAGFTELHELMLKATRTMEDRLRAKASGRDELRAEAATTFLPIVVATRHVLVVCKLLGEGHNPYDASVGRETWLALLEGELANRRECFGNAAGWACNLGYIESTGRDEYELTPLGMEVAQGLTPYNE